MRDGISIVIPILDEATELPALIESLRRFAPEVDVVFVDGGSTDASGALVAAAGHRVIASARGRARQMNAGAQATRGEILIFLHADVRLPVDAIDAIRAAMSDARVVAGCFDLAYDTGAWPYPWIAWLGNRRGRLTKILTGDHTIFVRRSVFISVRGYPDIPLMEDVELSRRLRRRGRLVCLGTRVLGSTRKCQREGVWRTIALMWAIRTLYALGVTPARLHRLYYRRDRSKLGENVAPQAGADDIEGTHGHQPADENRPATGVTRPRTS